MEMMRGEVGEAFLCPVLTDTGPCQGVSKVEFNLIFTG